MEKEKKTKIFNMSHYLLGARFDNWIRLLWRTRFKIQPSKIPQCIFITILDLILFPFALIELLVCAIPIHRTKIQKDPIFILGHWRSGTTFLQNVMSQDPQFGWAGPLETIMFSNCVLLGWMMRGSVKEGLKNARPMDNVQYKIDLPMEETFALANFTPYCFDHLMTFPVVWETFLDSAFVDRMKPRRKKAFMRAYQYAMKKVTWRQHGKQLLLKSPDNTARIGTMLEMYPDAKFVNIYRDPYDMLLSVVNMFKAQMGLARLSVMPDVEVTDYIENVAVYQLVKPMYTDLFQWEDKFEPHHFVNVQYEQFVKDPVKWLKYIYDELELDGFEEALPYMQRFLAQEKDYKKNQHVMRPELRKKINDELGFYFEHYGYEMHYDDETTEVQQ